MPPSPAPTGQQIDKVREIAGENDFDYVSDLIDDLSDARWIRALELMVPWAEYPAGDAIALQGGRDAVLYSSESSREDIRRRLRLLLGLPELRDASLTGMGYSHAVRTTWVW